MAISLARGQAAISDALFLLAIVVGVSTLLYLFSSNYGVSTAEYLNHQYSSDYTTAALKTILFASISHDPAKPLAQTHEVDYVLTIVKEGYAYKEPHLLDDRVLVVLRDRVRRVMKPLENSRDYLFYIQETTQASRFLFIYAWLSEFPPGTCSAGGSKTLSSTTVIPHREYFCVAKNETNVLGISQRVNGYAQSVTGIGLGEVQNGSINGPIPGVIFLAAWTPNCLPQGTNGGLFQFRNIPLAESDSIAQSLYDPNNPTAQSIQAVMNDPATNNGRGLIYCIPFVEKTA